MTTPGLPQTPHPALGLMLLLLPTAMLAVDANVLFLALPALTAALHATALDQLWLSDIYAVLVGALVIVAGALGDRHGRRRVLMLCCAGFGIASLVAGLAPNIAVLLVARIVQGIAGAGLAPSCLALLSELYPDPAARGRAIGVWASCQFAAAALGPLLGGVLLHYLWWGAGFLANVPICAAVILLAPRLLPEHTDKATPRVDLRSSALLALLVLALLATVKVFVPGSGMPWWLAPMGLVVAVTIAWVFTHRQGHLDEPLLDLSLLRLPTIWRTIAALVLTGITLAGTSLVISQALQSAVGLDALRAALATAPMGLGIALGTLTAPRLTKLVPERWMCSAGLVLSALAAAAMLLLLRTYPLPLLIAGPALLAFGCGPLFAFGTSKVIGAAPTNAAGRVAGITETGNYVGSSIGIALLGTLATATYARTVAPAVATEASDLRASVLANLAQGHLVSLNNPPLAAAVRDAGLVAAQAGALLVLVLTLGSAALMLPSDSADQ